MPSAWPLDRFTPEVVVQVRGCKPSEVPDVLKRCAADQADPAWIARTVANLCVPALAVVETLALHGGMLHISDLDALVLETFGIQRPAVSIGLVQLHRDFLAVPLGTPRGAAVALVAPAADRIAARVAGIAALAPIVDDDAERHDEGRILVAVAAMLAQVDLKLTQGGSPHRAHVKRIAKQVGLDEARLERTVIVAWRLGLLGELPDGTVRPLPEPLMAATEGRFPGHRVVDHAAARVRALGTVTVSALDGWIKTCRIRGVPTFNLDDLGLLPGLVAHGPRDERVTSVSPSAFPEATAATIAPNFEVFLPPEARLSDVAHILSVCEPVRLDRMIVARITKASITRAAAAGRTGDQLLATLAAASRTPLPQNVSAAIRDWTSSTTHATIYTGRVIVVPPADEARLIAALPLAAAARSLAPGVVAISEATPDRAVTTALDKLSIIERRDDASAPRDLRSLTDSGVELPGLLTAPDELRARVAAFRAGDAGEHARVRAIVPFAPATVTEPPRQPSAEVRWRDRMFAAYGYDDDDGDDDDDHDDARLDAELAMSPAVRSSLEAFERRIGEELPGEAFHALAITLEALPLHDRRYILAPSSYAETKTRLLALLASRAPAGPAAQRAFDELARLLGAKPTAAGKATHAVEWNHDGLLARLEAAARTHSTLLLDVGAGEPRRIAITRLSMRGSALFVLGDDANGNGVAIRYASIRAIADPSLSAGSTTPARWTPLEGMAPPPGHEPCPCGSGKRYRQCCRSAPN